MPDLPSNPFANSAAQVEKVVQSFEEAWQRGDEVTIDDFRHITGVDSRLLLVELVHTELELRLQAGELVLFPSWLLHEVLPYEGDDVRITVAFNVRFMLAGAQPAEVPIG